MDGPPRGLHHNICRDVPQIFYDIGNLTTALEKWRFDGHLTACSASQEASIAMGKGPLFQAGMLKWGLKRQNMTRLCWTQVEGNTNGSPHNFQRKGKICFFQYRPLTSTYEPFSPLQFDLFSLVLIDSGNQLTTLLVIRLTVKIRRNLSKCQNIVRAPWGEEEGDWKNRLD